MKKTMAMLAAALLCITAASGCSDDTLKTNVRKNNSIAESSSVEEIKEDTDESSEKPEESAKETEENSESSTEAEQLSIPEEQISYSNESGELTDIAVELHKKSCETKWGYILSCPYELDQEDTTENGACRVIGVDSVEKIKAEYSAVFADSSEIDEKYFEQDGKVYCNDGGRGVNMYYTGTELITVSESDTEALFTAVSHYADPDTKEPMDSRSYDFKMVNVDGVWKTAEFTLPY